MAPPAQWAPAHMLGPPPGQHRRPPARLSAADYVHCPVVSSLRKRPESKTGILLSRTMPVS